jgi:hypothetical protein
MRFGLPMVLVLFAAAGAVSYFGTRSNRSEPFAGLGALTQPRSPAGPVVSITLPFDEPDLPPGPHQREFQVSCTTCHSTRLALTQPPFPKAKWEATVKKMVDAYGAPLTPENQARAVEYLMAVRGQ